jgi:hypothetical protein
MALSHSRNVEVNHSNLTDIGRDQNFIDSLIQIGKVSVAINFSLFPSLRRTSCPVISAASHAPQAGLPTLGILETSSRNIVPAGTSTVDSAVRLIVQIVRLLIGPHAEQSLDQHKDLRLELIALYDTLVMTGTIIHAYENTYVRRTLVNVVTPEVNQCREVLEELLHTVNETWWSLSQTSIQWLWHLVCWSRWYGDELVSLRRKLLESRESLRIFLMALNSCVLPVFYLYVMPNAHMSCM